MKKTFHLCGFLSPSERIHPGGRRAVWREREEKKVCHSKSVIKTSPRACHPIWQITIFVICFCGPTT